MAVSRVDKIFFSTITLATIIVIGGIVRKELSAHKMEKQSIKNAVSQGLSQKDAELSLRPVEIYQGGRDRAYYYNELKDIFNGLSLVDKATVNRGYKLDHIDAGWASPDVLIGARNNRIMLNIELLGFEVDGKSMTPDLLRDALALALADIRAREAAGKQATPIMITRQDQRLTKNPEFAASRQNWNTAPVQVP